MWTATSWSATASIVGTLNGHAFAYDLGAATPRMSDLGPAANDGAEDGDALEDQLRVRVSGNVVAGTQFVGQNERAVAWTLSTTTAPALRFAKIKTFVRENAVRATITVVRDGDTSAPVTVKYGTRDIGGRHETQGLHADPRHPVLRSRPDDGHLPSPDRQRQAPRRSGALPCPAP